MIFLDLSFNAGRVFFHFFSFLLPLLQRRLLKILKKFPSQKLLAHVDLNILDYLRAFSVLMNKYFVCYSFLDLIYEN